MSMPTELSNVLKSHDLVKKCMKLCDTSAYRIAMQRIEKMFADKMNIIKMNLSEHKIDVATFMKAQDNLRIEKIRAMKAEGDVVKYYECGLTSCKNDVSKFRTNSIKLLEKNIQDATSYIQQNKRDITKKMLVDYYKDTLKRDRKRLKLLDNQFTVPTLIEFLQ